MAAISEQDSQGKAPIPDIPAGPKKGGQPPKWANNDAKREDENWDTLDQVKLENNVRWLRIYGKLLVIVTVVFTLTFLGTFVAWILHYTTSLQWLSEDQLGKIQSVLFSGGMGAIVSNIIRNQINKT